MEVMKTATVEWFRIEEDPGQEKKVIVEFENGTQQYIWIFGETWSRIIDKLTKECTFTGKPVAWCYSPQYGD